MNVDTTTKLIAQRCGFDFKEFDFFAKMSHFCDDDGSIPSHYIRSLIEAFVAHQHIMSLKV